GQAELDNGPSRFDHVHRYGRTLSLRTQKFKVFSHWVIFTLVERPSFDHDNIIAAKPAPARFITSNIAVKDFDTALNFDLAEDHWPIVATYRKRVMESKDGDPIWILGWLVCEKRTSRLLQIMPVAITRKDLSVEGPKVAADPMPWGEVVDRVKELVESGKAMVY
ncbi:hypothetical protein FRB96_003684, partial [Tulasnella sp. 330]